MSAQTNNGHVWSPPHGRTADSYPPQHGLGGASAPQLSGALHDASVIWKTGKYAVIFAFGIVSAMAASGWIVAPAKQTDLEKLQSTVATSNSLLGTHTETLKALLAGQADLQRSTSRMEGYLTGMLQARVQPSPPSEYSWSAKAR